MSFKAASWLLIVAIAFTAVILLNYWGSYQPLSTLVYTGIVLALCGLANVALPFRFLGIRKRWMGALLLLSGAGLAAAALFWPAPTVRVAQPRTMLDNVVPEYQFSERHSQRVRATPQQALQAVQQSTFGDMRSLGTLLKIRAAALRIHDTGESLQDKRVLDAFSSSGYLSAGSEREVVMVGVANVRAGGPVKLQTLQQIADYREPGGIKIGYDFRVDDVEDGWCTISTETRVMATDDATRRGMGRYWRLIVPGSGLLRRQWLDGIKRRAETAPIS